MTDLATLMRDQARAGLQTQLDTAVTEGNTEAARKITDQIAALAVQTAPKTPPYGEAEIRAEMDKFPWFGVDPKKSGRALQLGKDLNPKKFPTAEAFAAAVAKAVEEESKPATSAKKEGEDDENEGSEGAEGEESEGEESEGKDKKVKVRRTDGPGSQEATNRTARRTSGPWAKLADAPKEVQTEIKRSAEKFVPADAPKERREGFIKKALESHYAVHQRANAGKK